MTRNPNRPLHIPSIIAELEGYGTVSRVIEQKAYYHLTFSHEETGEMFRLKVKPCIHQEREGRTTTRYKLYASSELNDRRDQGKPLPHAFVFYDNRTYWVPEPELGRSSMSLTTQSPHERTNKGGTSANYAVEYELDVQIAELVDQHTTE